MVVGGGGGGGDKKENNSHCGDPGTQRVFWPGMTLNCCETARVGNISQLRIFNV